LSKLFAWVIVVGLACSSRAPQSLAPASAPCVVEGEALDFLKGITGEWLNDSADMAQVGWRASLKEVEVVSLSPICLRAVEELTDWGSRTRPDSVAVLRAGNRYTAVRVDDLNVVMLLDEGGRQVRAGVLQ
jgi:hypothetical protein